jgi:ABC-2 type transport system ATP-binding protein
MLIQVTDLTFDYPGHRALNEISFEVAEGEIMALVGPNGAGKTTLMRCLAALLTPLAGDIQIDGIDVQAQPKQLHRRLGYLSDFFGLYDELSVARCLSHQGATQGLRGGELADAVTRAAKLLQLSDRLEQPVAALSRGWRQRTAIAMAIIHRPKLLLLDEPASGLDPEARESLSALMLDLQREGHTIIVSSHILSELEEYCTGMMILRDGRIGLHDMDAVEQVFVTLKLTHPVDGLVDILQAYAGVEEVRPIGPGAAQGASLKLAGDQDRAELLAALISQGLPISDFHLQEVRLQDVYLNDARDQSPASNPSYRASDGATDRGSTA